MSNLTKFLHAMAEGIAGVAEQIDADPGGRGGSHGASALRDYFSQLSAVAEAAERGGGEIDWRELGDKVGIDPAPEPEREPGGPALLGGRLRLPGIGPEDGYEWFDLAAVAAALRAPTNPPSLFGVDVTGREGGIYLFAVRSTAEAFADAVTSSEYLWRGSVADIQVHHDEGAEDLIARERGDMLEDLGYPLSADGVRERKPLTAVLAAFERSPEGDTEPGAKGKELLRKWIDLDARRPSPSSIELVSADSIHTGDWIALDVEGEVGGDFRKVSKTRAGGGNVHVEFADDEPAASFAFDERVWRRKRDAVSSGSEDEDAQRGAPEPRTVEPAYTVFGIYLEPAGPLHGEGDRFQNYATAVYTHEGPHAAAAIAQRVCREDNHAETGEDLLQIVAVIAGEHDVLDA